MDADAVTWITDRIAITNFFSAHQREVLAEHKIDAILNPKDWIPKSLSSSSEPSGNRRSLPN